MLQILGSLLFIVSSYSCQGQQTVTSQAPTETTMQTKPTLSPPPAAPNTIVATVEVLSVDKEQNIYSVKIKEVLAYGSGILQPLAQGQEIAATYQAGTENSTIPEAGQVVQIIITEGFSGYTLRVEGE